MMTEKLSTIARPYALAAFEYAFDKQDLAGWEAMLQMAALIEQNEAMISLLSSPGITQNELLTIFFDAMSTSLDDEKKNFLRLLGEYERLEALPEIAMLFKKYRADYEKKMTVRVVSAVPISEATQKKLREALTRRLKNEVQLECEVDDSLLGGAIIRAGDRVIDGSIRGKLNRLLESI